jgi:enamine deaminase RidA (YjgF/YER057c/UK114 family)
MYGVSTFTEKSLHEADRAFALMSRGGDHVWLSNQTAHDEHGRIVDADDVAAQARYIFTKSANAFAEHAGVGMDAIVRLTTCFVPPLEPTLTSQYLAVRREFFGSHAAELMRQQGDIGG